MGGERVLSESKSRKSEQFAALAGSEGGWGKVNLDEYRVCLDARPLNEKNNSKHFSLPKIADIIKKATKATMRRILIYKTHFIRYYWMKS